MCCFSFLPNALIFGTVIYVKTRLLKNLLRASVMVRCNFEAAWFKDVGML